MSHPDKYLLNDPKDLVVESLQGLCATHNFLGLDGPNKVVFCKDYEDIKENQVTLISGGGSGHEPAHAGYVGSGMLTAAVAGQVFASPSSGQILKALRRVASPDHGSLIIVKNYTGDVINFGRAIERARWEGIVKDIKMVIVADDVGVTSGQEARDPETGEASDVGRRGLAGTVLVHKVAGAAAALGESLDEVYRAAQSVTSNLATIGVSLSTCTVPGSSGESRHLGPKEVEFGLGIHGEPGFETKPLETVKDTVTQMLRKILESPEMRTKLGRHQTKPHSVVLLVNNLGSTTLLEMNAATREALLYLRSHHVRVLRAYTGAFVTALDMHGISITLLAVHESREKAILRYLSHEAHVPGWNNASGASEVSLSALTIPLRKEGSQTLLSAENLAAHNAPEVAVEGSGFLRDVWKPAIIAACESAIEVEPTVTRYDTVWGDADCGLTLKSGATAIMDGFSKDADFHIPLDTKAPDHTIAAISELVEDSMGGTSGGLYCIMLDAVAAQIQGLTSEIGNDGLTLTQWAQCLTAALETLQRYTTARKGHRTLMDSLIPFIESFGQSASSDQQETTLQALSKAVEAARQGMEATKKMVPRRGRATYIGDQGSADSEKYQIPDPGAYGLVAIFEGILKANQGSQ
ncbi:Dihydroxyacetone kinase 2 [Tieghemiomyces parasiticus]|uniref:Dihydroxyacetone kinase 2 n=1 Tax=Tieghemiomyces parasiticus TaxID=78921 RepID=A0A9W8AC07_9FUNG|nr:Dihydroxyacetone kinase 2 [Tieghemiomyces parasiticus]